LALNGSNFSAALYFYGSISQTGQIPVNAKSLQFEASSALDLNVTLGGQNLPYSAISEGSGYTLYGANIPGRLSNASGFSVTLGGQTLSYSLLSEGANDYLFGANIPADLDGQTEALSFGCFGLGSGGVVLDNIQFSPASVPEPDECALVGLGGIVFWIRRRVANGGEM
jgi:hypothetical protein